MAPCWMQDSSPIEPGRRLVHKLLWPTLAASLLAGCAAPAFNAAPRIDAGQTSMVADSKFDSAYAFSGPAIRWNKSYGFGAADEMTARVVTLRDKSSGSAMTGIALEVVYWSSSWRFYSSANLDNATNADTRRVSSDVRCGRGDCKYTELVAVAIPWAFFDARQSTGFEVRVNAQKGPPVVVTVPATHVQQALVARQQGSTSSPAITPKETAQPTARINEDVGPDSRMVQQLPEALRCQTQPVALLVGTWLASLSTYKMICKDGSTLLARCEYGNCRILK